MESIRRRFSKNSGFESRILMSSGKMASSDLGERYGVAEGLDK